MSTLKENEILILEKINNNIRKKIIYDGIINEDEWKNSECKIKFVLKDPNAPDVENIIDLINLPYNDELKKNYNVTESDKKIINNLQPTYRNVGRWTYGVYSIYNKTKKPDKNWDWISEELDWLKELQKISIINIKKTPGGRQSIDYELREAIKSYGRQTWQQINYDAPKFVIFCGTGDLFKNTKLWINEPPITKWKKTDKGFEYFKMEETFFIKFWHPNAYFPDNMMYYTLMDIVSELSEKNNV